MDKTSQKVTKDPKKVGQGKKSFETCMKRLKEQILEEHQPRTFSSTCSPTPSTCNPTPSTCNATSSTCDPTSSISSFTCDPTPSISSSICDPKPSTSSYRPNDIYVYGVGMLAVLVIGACVFFAYNTSQAKNKKEANEKKRINHQNDGICFRKIYNK